MRQDTKKQIFLVDDRRSPPSLSARITTKAEPYPCGRRSSVICGYYALLKAINHPDDASSQRLRDWLGDDFDPRAISIEGVDRLQSSSATTRTFPVSRCLVRAARKGASIQRAEDIPPGNDCAGRKHSERLLALILVVEASGKKGAIRRGSSPASTTEAVTSLVCEKKTIFGVGGKLM